MNKLICCLSALFLLCACGEKIEPGRSSVEPPVIGGLSFWTVTAGPLGATDIYVGTVESPDRGVLAARIDGRVGAIAVSEGDYVAGGALLLEIADSTAADRLEEGEGALAEAAGGKAMAAARLDLAEKTAERYRILFAAEAVTPREMDGVRADLEVARQRLASAEAALRRSEAARDAARTASSHTRVTAPYDARISRHLVEEGSTVMPGTPLLILDRRGRWRVRAAIPESKRKEVDVGDPFTVEIPALGRTLPAEVAAILPTTDPRSRSFEIKLSLPPGADLSAGLFARVMAEGKEPEGILAATAAVVTRGQLTGVYAVEEGVLRYRLVKTGRRAGDRVEILSGLKVGEIIVVEGADRAKNGARVEN